MKLNELQIFGVDPRTKSKTKIKGTYPLPYVSRQQLKKIKYRLAKPETCHLCQSPVRLVHNREIFNEEAGDWPYAYMCTKCKAYVGLHRRTDVPLGTLATPKTHELRSHIKYLVNRLFRPASGEPLSKMYADFSNLVNIPSHRCHVDFFDEETCKSVLKTLNEALKTTESRNGNRN